MELIAGTGAGRVVGVTASGIIRGLLAKHELVAADAAHRERIARLEGEIDQGGDARRVIEDAKEHLGEAVKAEVVAALRDNSRALVGMADENFQKTMAAARGELDRKHKLFQALVKPLSEGYKKLNPQIEQLSVQVQSVTAETAKLSGALSDNRQVGKWGEIQLRRVVELAGMARHCDFVEQPTIKGTRGRPDMAVVLVRGDGGGVPAHRRRSRRGSGGQREAAGGEARRGDARGGVQRQVPSVRGALGLPPEGLRAVLAKRTLDTCYTCLGTPCGRSARVLVFRSSSTLRLSALTTLTRQLVDIQRKLCCELDTLQFGQRVVHHYNPLSHAQQPAERYLRLYLTRRKPEALLLGMNPSPWGMTQSGVPFGDVELVRNWLQINIRVQQPAHQHCAYPIQGSSCQKRDNSGRRLWGWARSRFETPQEFFARFAVLNYCPLCFIGTKPNGNVGNLTLNKLAPCDKPRLFKACDAALVDFCEALRPERVIGIGRFATTRAQQALIGSIKHPSTSNMQTQAAWITEIEEQLGLS